MRVCVGVCVCVCRGVWRCMCVCVCACCVVLPLAHTAYAAMNGVLQRTATHCNTLQHTAAHCNKLQHTSLPHVLSYSDTRCVAVYCSALIVCCSNSLHTAVWCHDSLRSAWKGQCNTLQHTATHYKTLQHTATRCNTLQHAATHYNTLQHTATYCILHHTAPHCNILLRCHDGLRSA